MNKVINLGNIKYSLSVLNIIKNADYVPVDIRITNSQITRLNKVLGYVVFRKDALYISSSTLYEIMQPTGGMGRHHFHGLKPEEILNALLELKNAKDITESYDGRYLIITLATTSESAQIAIVIDPNSLSQNDLRTKVIKIITIYPHKKKK